MRELLLAVAVFAAGCGSLPGQAVDAGVAPVVSSRPPGPARVSGGAMAATILERTTPVYPPLAKAAGVSGSVVLHALVDKTGRVENLTVVNGPEMLRAAALEAVRGWVYKPYLLNGEPTEVDTVVTVNFSLAGDSNGLRSGGGGASPEGAAEPAGKPAEGRLDHEAPRGPVRISGGVLQGMLEEKVDPVYPATQESGAVVMKVRVNEEGEVADVTAVSGPASLRAASVEAVQQWSYRPYLLNGVPTAVDSTVTVMFTRH